MAIVIPALKALSICTGFVFDNDWYYAEKIGTEIENLAVAEVTAICKYHLFVDEKITEIKWNSGYAAAMWNVSILKKEKFAEKLANILEEN